MQAQARKSRPASIELGKLDLASFVPRCTPRWSKPVHLGPLVRVLERAERERVRALVSVPPRHGKTELCLHAIAWMLRRRPDRTHAYCSYADAMARSKSRLARSYAIAAGVQLAGDSRALNEWRTPEGGGLLATGVGGPLTGHGVTGILVVDDPHKNRAEAESQARREEVFSWYTSTAATRLSPDASAIIVHTRWHPDDLIGRLSEGKRGEWEVINLQALAEEETDHRRAGEALWPEVWSVDVLRQREIDVGPYDWASLYQGRPRPRGGSVFGDTHLYSRLPDRYRVAIGLDLAYTKKTSSDRSVAVVMAEASGEFYVVEVVTAQVAVPQFAAMLKDLARRYPSAMVFIYAGGTERGVIDMLVDDGLPIEHQPAVTDKFVRAQRTAADWNAGRIFLPDGEQDWVSPFVSEVRGFTGVGDARDDQVDALVAAHDALAWAPDDVSLFGTRFRR